MPKEPTHSIKIVTAMRNINKKIKVVQMNRP